ncbi:hypothetical protein GF312_22975 [Candidatus Poribacteria bacterium]|nr:hypothetical protein [Candidatus Poribacteria bacterium]
MTKLKVGTAAVNITPYAGINMTGFGNRVKPSEGIHDDLYAKAVVFYDGQIKICLVSCDLLNLDESSVSSIRNKVKNMTDIDVENVFISTTHTHSGPQVSPLRGFGKLDRQWVSILEKKIAGAVSIANRNMVDAQLGAGIGHVEINVNRRQRQDDRVILGVNPAGAIDYQVGIIKIQDTQDKNICTMVNYACHPVVMGGDNYLISRDYPGYAMDFVENANGENSIAMFFNGMTGDLNPARRGTFEDAASLGKVLGAEVVKVSEAIQTSPDVEIKTTKEIVKLNSGQLPSKEELKAIIDRRKQEINQTEHDMEREITLTWARDALTMVKKVKLAAKVPVEVQVIKLGDIGIVGIPGEVFVDIGLSIKKDSPFNHTFVTGYTNGCIGYMPTQKAFQEGGYETHSAYMLYGIYPVDQNVANKIIKTSLKLMQRLSN